MLHNPNNDTYYPNNTTVICLIRLRYTYMYHSRTYWHISNQNTYIQILLHTNHINDIIHMLSYTYVVYMLHIYMYHSRHACIYTYLYILMIIELAS